MGVGAEVDRDVCDGVYRYDCGYNESGDGGKVEI